jgi:Family of unknown function (DUF6174)
MKILLSFVAFAAALTGFSSAAPEPKDLTLKSLAQYEARWNAQKPRSYSFTLERTCFCAPRLLSARFQVTGGISKMVSSNAAVAREQFQAYVSVDKLFKAAKEILQNGGRVAVTYDAKRIDPVQIILDRNIQAADDELYLTVSKFSR